MTDEDAPERTRASAAVAAAAILVYGVAVFTGGFHYDDSHHVAENPAIRSLENVPAFFADAGTFSTIPNHRLYRPVLMTSFALDWAAGHGVPYVFLGTNLLLHVFCALLVLAIARRVFEDELAALLAGLLFAAHPIASETVNYVSARSSSLATLFVLLTVLSVLRWDGRRTAAARAWLAASLGFFALGLLTKAIAATAPALAFLAYETRRVRRGDEGSPLRTALALAPAALVLGAWYALVQAQLGNVAAGLAKRVVHQDGGGGLAREKRSVLMNVWTQARVFWMYVGLTLVPVRLSIDRFVRVSTTVVDVASLVSLAGIGALIVYVLKRAGRALRLGVLWFGVALLPTSSVLPLLVVMNEHRLYLPLVGFALLGGVALAAVARRPRGRIPVAIALVALGALAFTRSLDWRDDETLWRAALRVSPQSYQAHANLGILRYEAARRMPEPDLALIDEAIAEFERSREIFPGWFNASFNLGNAWLLRGQVTDHTADFDRAEAAYRTCLEVSPGSFRARWHLAATAAARGRHEKALAGFRELRAQDDSKTALYWWPIGRQLIELERWDEALETYAKIEELAGPSDDLALLRAEIDERRGRLDDAEAALRRLVDDEGHDRVRAIGALVRFLRRTERATPEVLNALFERLLKMGYRPSPEEAALFDRDT